MISGVSSATAASSGGKGVGDVSPDDFLNILITQLTNQDPFEPMKNQELLEQMSAIRGLQSEIELQDTLETMVLQQQISSAGSLIGKVVTGLNENLDPVTGQVTSLSVQDGSVYLDLDTGQRMRLADVTRVSEPSLNAPAE
jgi:flagellar basal-body rod modification protein FlgD